MWLLVLALLTGPPAAPAAPRAPSIEAVGFLAGCWKGKPRGGEGSIDEMFTAPEGGLVLGTSRVVDKGVAVFWELMRIEQTPGAVTLTVLLKSGKTAAFRLVRGEPGLVVFENPALEFPRSITYRLAPDGTLDARVEGAQAGAPRALAFALRRLACPGAR